MSDSPRAPSWAVLVPGAAGPLGRRADAQARRLAPGAELGWQVVAGSRRVSAVVDRAPGAAGAYDEELAAALSRDYAGPVYLLRFDEDLDLPVLRYKGGRPAGTVDADPFHFAREKGVELGGAPAAEAAAPAPVPGAAVLVPGAGEAQVRKAIAADDDLRGRTFHLHAAGDGVLVREPGAPLHAFLFDVGYAFASRTVYGLETGPQAGRFRCWVVRGAEVQGLMALPEPTRAEAATYPIVAEVQGADTPGAVLRALGVAPELMGMVDDG